jgi:hypothetical protein
LSPLGALFRLITLLPRHSFSTTPYQSTPQTVKRGEAKLAFMPAKASHKNKLFVHSQFTFVGDNTQRY